jgi:hypothetical protein
MDRLAAVRRLGTRQHGSSARAEVASAPCTHAFRPLVLTLFRARGTTVSLFGGKATDLSAPDCVSTFRGEGDGARAWCRLDDGREVATVRCAS